MSEIKRVTGIGGVFFKAQDPQAQMAWYQKHLGIQPEASGPYSTFKWRQADDPERSGTTVWSLFDAETKYFGPPGRADFMINYRVDDLDAVLAALEAEGVTILPEREEAEYGRFAWIIDPEGNRVELWEPPAGM